MGPCVRRDDTEMLLPNVACLSHRAAIREGRGRGIDSREAIGHVN